jgi:tetratricopeptide (TPR) repeat protein
MERDYLYEIWWPEDCVVDSSAFCGKCFVDYFIYHNQYATFVNVPKTKLLDNYFQIPILNAAQSNKYDVWGGCWECWKSDSIIYSGYLFFLYKSEFPFLTRQIKYCIKYPGIQAYWPETSENAEKINDLGIKLFDELISNAGLNELLVNENLYKKFFVKSWWPAISIKDEIVKGLVSSCFRFSDYYRVYKDLLRFSYENFSEDECNKIEIQLNDILETLSYQFLEIYNESLSSYPTQEIMDEVAFIEYLTYTGVDFDMQISKTFLPISACKCKNKLSRIKADLSDKINLNVGNCDDQPPWFAGDFFFEQGCIYNSVLMYHQAIDSLSKAIMLDPLNKEAHLERAYAYFELDQIDKSLEDFQYYKALDKQFPEFSITYNIVVQAPHHYALGFHNGVNEGAMFSLIEYVPSTLNCLRGMLNGLWVFACSPEEVSKDLLKTSYELVEFIKQSQPNEILELLVPELKQLCLKWGKLTDFERGYGIGFIIGKYGADIYIPGAAIKTIKKVRALKRANTAFTIERCLQSQSNKTIILTQSTKRAAAREAIRDLAKSGKVIPRNSNVIPHIMQTKHAWEKVIILSGDVEKDFQKVVAFLEKNNIFNGKKEYLGKFSSYLKEIEINRIRYTVEVNGFIIEADFIEYAGKNEIFINDAWVRVKK